MVVWNGEHHAFVIKTYLQNNDSHCNVVTSCDQLIHQIHPLVITSFGVTERCLFLFVFFF